MARLKTMIGRFATVCHVGASLVFAGAAIAAAFGFAHPAMDLFNHGQPVLFAGLALLLASAPLVLGNTRALPLALTVAATGLTASAFIYVPEAIDGLSGRGIADGGGGDRYRLVTFNVFGRNEAPHEIVATIDRIDPDIVALQEYSPQVRRAIHEALAERFPNFQYCAGGERAFVGLYSNLPFEPLSEDLCSASAVSTDRTARIMASFVPENGPAFALATTHNDWPAPVTRQVEQFNALAGALETVDLPLIVVGDFNSTPWSYALRGFVDQAGLTRHTYNLPTFPTLWYYLGDWRPTPAILPIDHVMTRDGVAVRRLATGDPSGSDHLPIIVEFSVNEGG